MQISYPLITHTHIGDCTTLFILFDKAWSDPPLTGSIASLVGLKNLQTLLLNDNDFVGPVPSLLGNLTGLSKFRSEKCRSLSFLILIYLFVRSFIHYF